MSQRRRTEQVLLVLVVVLLMIGGFSGATKAQDAASIPSVTVGDTWTYVTEEGKNRTFTVTAVTATGITGRVSGDLNGTVQWDEHWNTMRHPHPKDGTYVASPRRAVLQFPLAAGKSWKGTYTSETNRLKKDVEEQARVIGRVEVSVPGGTFTAWQVRVTSREEIYNKKSGWRGTGTLMTTIWYAPEIHREVQRTWQLTWRGKRPGARSSDSGRLSGHTKLTSYQIAGQ